MTTGWSHKKVGWMQIGSITDDIIASSTPATVALPLATGNTRQGLRIKKENIRKYTG